MRRIIAPPINTRSGTSASVSCDGIETSSVCTCRWIIAAAYLLWAIQRILFNALDKPENMHIPDLNGREVALLAPLVACIIWLGFYPAPVLRRMEGSAERFVQLVQQRSREGQFVTTAPPGGVADRASAPSAGEAGR